MIKLGVAFTLLLSSYCAAFDLNQATTPPPKPAVVEPEKGQFEFHSKEDALSAFSSGEARTFLRFFDVDGAPSLSSDGSYNIQMYDRNLREVLVNSYGLEGSVKDLVHVCRFEYSQLRDGSPFYRDVRLLAESMSYDKRFKVGELLNNAATFSGEYPDEPAKRQKFSEDFSTIVSACSGSEAADAVLTAYKAYMQDVGTAIETFTKPKREALIASAAQYSAARKTSDARKATQEQCRNTQAYGLYMAAHGLEMGRATIASLRQQLQREEDITKESGAVNTTKKYNLGKQIKETEDARKLLFANYKQLGGKESSMDAVRAPHDPCK